MDKTQTIIGKDVIETLTLGMYEDSRVIYREYIQNSADQIDKAIKEGLLKKEECEIHIDINRQQKSISIEDNATGIQQSRVNNILKNIAQGTKERGVDKGFRGIGRLGGLGYCDTLIFETSFKGEAVKTIMTWNAKQLKEIINNRISKEEAAEVIDKVTSLKTEKENPNEHYFKVILQNISNDVLLDQKEIETYLSMAAPVPYEKGFILKQKIYDQLKKENICIDEYKIYINTNQLFKLYTTTIYKDTNGKKERTGDEIFDIHFFREHTQNGDLLHWGWYGVSQFEGVIDDINIGKGIRLRKGNIQIGSKHTLLKFFRDQQRGNYYFFGEVHAFSPDLIPNARRDYFLENSVCILFEKKLQELFHNELHQLYYAASKIRNANRRIQDLKTLQDESIEKEFISNKEKEDFHKHFESKKQEASKAKKELEKISSKFNENDSAVKKIFQKVVTTENINPEKIDLPNSNGKTTYRVDKLSKLTKEQRKFLSKIFEIITANCDKKTSDNIIKKIEEELQ
ncbi:MAG: ATP-binding protein [Bacteroidota bacterium]